MALNPLLGEIDHSFVEFVLPKTLRMFLKGAYSEDCATHGITNIVVDESLPVNLAGRPTLVLGIQIRRQLSLLRFFESDGLEKKASLRRIQSLDEICRSRDLGRSQWRQRMNCYMLGHAYGGRRGDLFGGHQSGYISEASRSKVRFRAADDPRMTKQFRNEKKMSDIRIV